MDRKCLVVQYLFDGGRDQRRGCNDHAQLLRVIGEKRTGPTDGVHSRIAARAGDEREEREQLVAP